MQYKESIQEKRAEQSLELGYTIKSGFKTVRQSLNPSLLRRAHKVRKIKKVKEKYQKKHVKEPSTWSILKDVWQHDNCKKDIIKTLGASALGGATQGTFGWTNGRFFEALSVSITQNAAFSSVAGWAGALIAQSSISNALGTLAMNFGNGVKAKIKAAEQNRLLQQLRALPQKFTQGQNAVERVGFAKQAAEAKGEATMAALRMFTHGATALVAFGLMAKISPEAALAVLGCSAAAVGMIRTMIQVQRSRNNIVKQFNNKTQAKLVDFMQNMPMIKNFHLERKSADISNSMVTKDERMQRKARTFIATTDSGLILALNAMIMGVGAYFAWKTGIDTGSIGSGLAVLTSSNIFVGRSNMFINQLSNLMKEKNTYIDSRHNFNPPENFHINSGNEQFSYNNSKVEMKNVSYVYEGTDAGLHNVSVCFEAGDIQVVAGRSGQGKSTLINMIRHLDDVNDGSVTISGVDVNNVSQEEIQNYITQMEQETAFLSTFTIKENLELMIPDEDDLKEALVKKEQGLISEEKYERMKQFHEHPEETIRKALEIAQIDEVYYSTDKSGNAKCDQMFGSFSGGERQRLALARAILADKEITILDEPTGALDSETTMDVIAKFKEFAKTHNLIMVTHSPDFIASAGKVVIVDKGRITGDGDAYQLLKSNSFIQNIFKGSPRHILETRKEVYKLMNLNTVKIDEQIVKEAEISGQYDKLKTDFEHHKKERFADMREFVAAAHKENISDATLEVQKRVLAEKNEMSEAYVQAAKKEIKSRRHTKEDQR